MGKDVPDELRRIRRHLAAAHIPLLVLKGGALQLAGDAACYPFHALARVGRRRWQERAVSRNGSRLR